MTLSPQFLDELRARTLLSALIGRSLKLQRAGREWKAPCPFHNEKTPSFYVNDDKGFYHCFGCSAHGDAIRWLTEQRGLPFIDAVKELADAAGMELPAPDPRAAERAERTHGLHDVMAAAQAWFAEQLAGIEGTEARAYLERRSVSADQVAAFGLGFAPDSRGKLKAALAHFGDAMLVEAGLLIAVDDQTPYDRFRGRLMIPIRDARGRCIAFGGRILGAGEPKYLNSPDTPLFDKGRTLWNLDRAGPASRKTGRLIAVEGYMDAIALAGVAIDDVVAPLGTALTEHQIARMWRLVDVPVLCFDGDAAGRKAAMRAALRALPLLAPGKSLDIVTLPAGEDPDDVVRSGGRAAFEGLLTAARPLVDHLWQVEHDAGPLRTPEQRAGLKTRLMDHIATIADPDVRRHYSSAIRERIDAQFFARPDFVPFRGKRTAPQRQPASDRARTLGGGIEAVYARAIMAGLVQHPALILTCAEALAMLRFAEEPLDRLRTTLVDAAYDDEIVECARLDPICASVGLTSLLGDLRAFNGLAFSFTRADADGEVARRDLAMAIEALAARPELDAALASATRRLAEGWDEDGLAEQMRLMAARSEADRKLAALANRDDEDDTGTTI
ncbi:MAG: DNA primase [Sphingomonadaceae bacterium]